jgi:hypothetical protein
MNRKPRTVAISQPFYFPWLGAVEIFFNADVYVFLDDVNFQKGGLNNRVKIKTKDGLRWLTVPLLKPSRNKLINEIEIDDRSDFRSEHQKILENSYIGAAHFKIVKNILDNVFSKNLTSLAETAILSEMHLFKAFDLQNSPLTFKSSDFSLSKKGSLRIIEIVKMLDGEVYLTAHGAVNYLDHIEFEKNGIEVRYMKYGSWNYPQLYGEFNPFVSSLDALACMGKESTRLITFNSIHWRDFISG